MDNCNGVAVTTPAGWQSEHDDWYETLIEDCRDLIVETEFSSRWSLVEGYHSLGQRILHEYSNFQRLRMADSDLVNQVSKSLNKRPRTVYYAIQFAREYPDLNLLPGGKNISWHHVVNKYLTKGEKQPHKSPSRVLKEIKELLQKEWLSENQRVVSGEVAENKSNLSFIRYLQDQVEKICTS